MSFEERNALSGLFASFAAWAIIGTSLWRKFQAGVFDGPDGVMLWARTMLWLMLVGIIVGIVLAIIFAIAERVLAGPGAVGTQVDERDRMIGLMGTRVVLGFVTAGIIGSIFGMAFGWTAVAGLTLIVAACAVGDTISTAYKVYLYRRGF